MKRRCGCAWCHDWGILLFLGLLTTAASAQDGAVSREEFNDLKQKYEALQKKVEGVEKNAVTSDAVDQSMDDLSDEIEEYLGQQMSLNSAGRPGETGFLLAGYAVATFRNGGEEDGSFGASFNPIFLWRIAPKLFFQAEFEVELEEDEEEFGLEYAQIVYAVNNWLTIGAGQFLNPFGGFWERIHPAWINRLPDKPLGYSGGADRLVPPSQLGVQARGAFSFRNKMRLTVAIWLSNGPELKTEDADTYGELEFHNFTDTNNNKAFGLRIGFVPIPGAEIGYSVELSQATPSGSDVDHADVVLQAFDASWHGEMKRIKGTLDLRFEFISSDIDDVVYDPTGASFGPASFDNKRTAWYVQVSYRPTLAEIETLKRLEIVYRFDTIDHPTGAPSGVDLDRSTIGLNYWLTQSSVVKAAVEFISPSGEPSTELFLLQWAIGF